MFEERTEGSCCFLRVRSSNIVRTMVDFGKDLERGMTYMAGSQIKVLKELEHVFDETKNTNHRNSRPTMISSYEL